MKYPYTIASVGRQDQIMAAHLKLFPYSDEEYKNMGSDDKATPLTLWNKFSGLKINFANSKNKTGGDGNIELNKLDDVWMRTQAVMPMLLTTATSKENPLLKPLGFVPGHSDLKGKNPIQIAETLGFDQAIACGNDLKNSSNGSYAKSNQKNGGYIVDAAYIATAKQQGFLEKMDSPEHRNQFLTENAANPNIAWFQQLAAICEQHPEYLDLGEASNSGNIIIYDAQMKTPHTKTVDKDGRTAVYSLSITANPNQAMPFCVTLVTGTGIPAANNDGSIKAIGIKSGTYQRGETFELRMTSAEWLNIISSAIKIRDAYAAAQIPTAMSWAKFYDEQERANRRNNQVQQPVTQMQQPAYQQYQQAPQPYFG